VQVRDYTVSMCDVMRSVVQVRDYTVSMCDVMRSVVQVRDYTARCSDFDSNLRSMMLTVATLNDVIHADSCHAK
jgi:hypothetical protein